MPVYARITVDGKRIELSIQQLVAKIDWNAKHGIAHFKTEECNVLNNYLKQLRSKKEIKQQQFEKDRIKKAWNYLYLKKGRGFKRLMDTVYYNAEELKKEHFYTLETPNV